MILFFLQEEIIEKLAAVFSYGLDNGYPYLTIEDKLVSSKFINDLENNYFDSELANKEVVESTYKIKISKDVSLSVESLFYAEWYIKLFFEVNKSFEYIFLYWPLSKLDAHYNVYHEMDITHFFIDFTSEVKKESLLKKICEKRNMKLSDLSLLTSININSIKKYALNDKYLFGASYEAIHKLAVVLKVKENIFLPSLGVYLDSSFLLEHKALDEFRNYLGLYYASYFDKRIKEKGFQFSKEKKVFFDKQSNLHLTVLYFDMNNLSFKSHNPLIDANTYLVIFVRDIDIHTIADCEAFKKEDTFETMIITEDKVFILRKHITREITETIDNALLVKTKIAINSNNN